MQIPGVLDNLLTSLPNPELQAAAITENPRY